MPNPAPRAPASPLVVSNPVIITIGRGQTDDDEARGVLCLEDEFWQGAQVTLRHTLPQPQFHKLRLLLNKPGRLTGTGVLKAT